MASPLDSIILYFYIPKRKRINVLNTVLHMGFEPTMFKAIGRVTAPGGDILDDLLDDLLTPCAGTLSTIAFTIYKTGNYSASRS